MSVGAIRKRWWLAGYTAMIRVTPQAGGEYIYRRDAHGLLPAFFMARLRLSSPNLRPWQGRPPESFVFWEHSVAWGAELSQDLYSREAATENAEFSKRSRS